MKNITPQAAVRRLLDWQPDAIAIRCNTGECPECGSPHLMTYTLPRYMDDLSVYGIYCPACHHHTAGRKTINQEQLSA